MTDKLIRAALEAAENIADAAMKKHAKHHYSGEPVRVFKSGDDQLSQSAAKAYCAGEILEAIRALADDPEAIAAIRKAAEGRV